jgi:hypothetical protein
MLEASEALGMKNDTTTLRIAKKMVDHTLAYGFDGERGGIYDGGYYFPGEDRPAIVRRTKEWWAQVEAFNSLLMMSELFPDDERHYYDKFLAQWEYCKTYLIDNEYGGWYWGGVDIEPSNRLFPKGTIWKGNYHTSRGLINCIRRLKSETLTSEHQQHNPVKDDATPEAGRLPEYLDSIAAPRYSQVIKVTSGDPITFLIGSKSLPGRLLRSGGAISSTITGRDMQTSWFVKLTTNTKRDTSSL